MVNFVARHNRVIDTRKPELSWTFCVCASLKDKRSVLIGWRASPTLRETESSQNSSSSEMAAERRYGVGKSLRVFRDLGSSKASITRGSSPGVPKVNFARVRGEILSSSYWNRDHKCQVQ